MTATCSQIDGDIPHAFPVECRVRKMTTSSARVMQVSHVLCPFLSVSLRNEPVTVQLSVLGTETHSTRNIRATIEMEFLIEMLRQSAPRNWVNRSICYSLALRSPLKYTSDSRKFPLCRLH